MKLTNLLKIFLIILSLCHWQAHTASALKFINLDMDCTRLYGLQKYEGDINELVEMIYNDPYKVILQREKYKVDWFVTNEEYERVSSGKKDKSSCSKTRALELLQKTFTEILGVIDPVIVFYGNIDRFFILRILVSLHKANIKVSKIIMISTYKEGRQLGTIWSSMNDSEVDLTFHPTVEKYVTNLKGPAHHMIIALDHIGDRDYFHMTNVRCVLMSRLHEGGIIGEFCSHDLLILKKVVQQFSSIALKKLLLTPHTERSSGLYENCHREIAGTYDILFTEIIKLRDTNKNKQLNACIIGPMRDPQVPLKTLITHYEKSKKPRLDEDELSGALNKDTGSLLWHMLSNHYGRELEKKDRLLLRSCCLSLLEISVKMNKFAHVQTLLYFITRDLQLFSEQEADDVDEFFLAQQTDTNANDRLFHYAIKKRYFSIAALFAIYNGTLLDEYPILQELYQIAQKDKKLALALVYQLDTKKWDGQESLQKVCAYFDQHLAEHRKKYNS